MAKNERKTRTKRAIFVVIALLLVAYLISSTYARYSTEGKADGKVDIAKWAVVMKAENNIKFYNSRYYIYSKKQ